MRFISVKLSVSCVRWHDAIRLYSDSAHSLSIFRITVYLRSFVRSSPQPLVALSKYLPSMYKYACRLAIKRNSLRCAAYAELQVCTVNYVTHNFVLVFLAFSLCVFKFYWFLCSFYYSPSSVCVLFFFFSLVFCSSNEEYHITFWQFFCYSFWISFSNQTCTEVGPGAREREKEREEEREKGKMKKNALTQINI